MICEQVFSILALVILLLKFLSKSASRSSFFALAPQDPAAISGAVARSSIVLCNSAPADRTVMAASRLLGAMAACVILLSFAAGHQNILESLHQGCDIVIGQQIFSILTRGIFLSQFLYKVLQNRLFLLWRRDPVLELQFLAPLRVVLLRFATRPLQDRTVMAASRLLCAAASGHRKSY